MKQAVRYCRRQYRTPTKYRLEYISTFHADIVAVSQFLDEYPTKAARLFAKIDRLVKALAEMPELYPIYADMPSYRFITVEDYLVFYNVNKQERVVELRRLLYGRMDIPSVLN
ncbi:MAG: type II toxin-antitoxin system RelE/ParE family toxin [Defluviitaleaceae bacterium]|nr:type II toxin-antitoxin system RelE/ParE family toxin [Defluviitaleaceae bacterium]